MFSALRPPKKKHHRTIKLQLVKTGGKQVDDHPLFDFHIVPPRNQLPLRGNGVAAGQPSPLLPHWFRTLQRAEPQPGSKFGLLGGTMMFSSWCLVRLGRLVGLSWVELS